MRVNRFYIACALSLSLTAPQLTQNLLGKESPSSIVEAKASNLNAARRQNSEGDEVQVSRLPVRLTLAQYEGLQAQPEKYDNPEFREACYLLSINGRPLAGMSAQEIQKFLRGNVGESAVLGILNRDLEYKEFSIQYEMLRRENRIQKTKSNLRSMLYNFDGTNGPRERRDSRGDQFEYYNLPVFVRAWAERHVFDAIDSPATSSAVVDSAAADSAENLLQIGNIASAKPLLKILEKSSLTDAQNRRRETDKYAKLMPLLNLWDMNSEAVSIGTKIVSSTKLPSVNEERYYDTSGYRLQNYIALSKVIKPDTNTALFDGMAAELTQTTNRMSDTNWLADYYERVGKYEQAISLYEKALAVYEAPSGSATNKDLDRARRHAYLLVRLAQLKNKKDKAPEGYLKRAAEVYRSNFTSAELAQIEKIPGFCPSLSQIDAVQNKNIKDGPNLLVDLKPIAAPGDPNQRLFEFATVTLEVSSALERADSGAVQHGIDRLFELYSQDEIRAENPRPAINMFCTLFTLSEKMADKGKYEQADDLLNRLRASDKSFDSNYASAMFIDLEKALNGSRSKKSDQWKRFFSNWNSGYQDYEGLRALAALYTTAGDTTRATILIDRAIASCKADADKNQARDMALLLLDKAWLEATQLHFADSQNYFKQSIETIDSTKVSGLSTDLNTFNRQYISGAVTLAQCYRSAGKADLAQDALKQVITRTDSGKSWLGVFDQSNGRAPDRSIPILYYYYARLLADSGTGANLDIARSYLDKAITATKNNVPGVMRFVRAKVAASQKDYQCAALDYSDVSQEFSDSGVQNLIMLQPDLKESYCRLALDFALKSKSLKGDELAKIYTRLADTLRPGSEKEQLELYNKAFPILSDGQEKQQLAIKIANLSGQLNATASGSSKVDFATEFKMREAAALLAQKKNPNYAAQLWATLADSEIRAKHYDSAIAHMKTAVAILEKQSGNYNSMFAPSFAYYMLPLNALAENGRKPDAEAIGKLVMAKAENLYGKQSAEYRIALTAMFSLYASQKDYKTASQYLNQILAIDPRKFELGRSGFSQLWTVEQIADGLTLKDETRSYGIEVLNKILTNRLSTYGPDDMRTMDILTKIGTSETKAGNFIDAEKHIKLALGIANLYDANGSLTFHASPVSAMHALLLAEKKTDEIKQMDEKIQSSRKAAEKNWSIPENAGVDATRKYYDFWHTRAPYNERSLNAGMKLLELSVAKKDWPAVKELATECIKMLAHTSPFIGGGCTPSPSPATRKFYCFKYLIQACLETGERQQALEWLKRAQTEKSYQPLPEELIFLSEIENICGNKKEALELCQQAEKALPPGPEWNYYRGPVNDLYRKLGSSSDTQRIQLEAQAQQLIRHEEEIRKFERERKLKVAEEATRKKLPAEAIATQADNNNNNNNNNKKRNVANKTEKEWSPEPPDALVLEPVQEVKDVYRFNYAALASDSLWLGEGVSVRQRPDQYPLPSYSFAGSLGSMRTGQPMHTAGSMAFLYDGPKGSLAPKFEIQQFKQAHPGGTGGVGGVFMGGSIGGFMGANGPMGQQWTAPEVMARPFLAAIKPPANSTAIDGKSLILKAGDYIADKLTVDRIVLPQPGRVRIFLKDKSSKIDSKYMQPKTSFMAEKYYANVGVSAFSSSNGAFINKGGPWDRFQQRSILEIWYNGTDTIFLGDETKFTGIIYAPNATIHLGKGVEFLGAMVGKTILAGPDTTIMYLPQLRNWKQDQ